MRESDTIAAIATPAGRGGIGIVRVSGSEAERVLEHVFRCSTAVADMEERKLYLGTVKAENFSDRCLAALFHAPNSYTGEDVAELHCHGGRTLIEGVLRAVTASGARMAVNGEFTKRAFLNGKMSLSAAEGVAEMIDAESEAELAAAYELERGGLSEEAERIQGLLTDLLAETEAALDDADEEVDLSALCKKLKPAEERLSAAEDNYRAARLLKEGVTVAVAGAPNAGKSSLLNAILRYDRAIVAGEPGTTRDTLEEMLELSGVKFRFIDTAGIRDTEDGIERQGVQRAKDAVKKSQLVLLVVDAAGGMTRETEQAAEAVAGKRVVLVCNKSDREGFHPQAFSDLPRMASVNVSAKTGAGISSLKDVLFRLAAGKLPENGVTLTNERHIGALSRARASVAAAADACALSTADAACLELKCAWDALGEITGTTATEEIVDAVFEKFCIGK